MEKFVEKLPVPKMLRITTFTEKATQTRTDMQVTLKMDDRMTAAGVLAADALDALGPRAVHLLPRRHPPRQRAALLFLADRQGLMRSCGSNA